MDTQFNIFEVLQIAEEVQTKAAKFCLRAAQQFADKERRNIYYSLATWHAKRRDTLKHVRRQYSERTGEFGVFDPDNYVLSNPGTMAGLTGYGTDPSGHGRPTGCETKEQIFHDAIRRSQGIIIFYHGLKEFARSPDSQMMIDNVISEEDRYVHLLVASLERMQASAEDRDNHTPVCWAELESTR